MFDRDQALGLLAGAAAELADAKEKLDAIRKEDGVVADLRQKRNAVKKALQDAETSLAGIRELVATVEPEPVEPPPDPIEPVTPPDSEPTLEPGSHVDDPTEPESPDVEPSAPETPEPEPIASPVDPDQPAAADDLFSLEDQHAVSRLMQDSAVHLAVIRRRNFWEIRHRNTGDGRASEPIRATTIAEAFAEYEREVRRPAGFIPFEPRPLTAAEQQALEDFRNIRTDNPRSVRWESGKTEVDYIDRLGQTAGGGHDTIEFPPGQLIDPIEHLKSVLD